jgi:protein TonB
MKIDLVLAVVFALLVHAGFALSGHFMKPKAEGSAPPEPPPIMELMALPPVEPDPPQMAEISGEAASDIADMAPPSLADAPSASIDSSFVQQIQPPSPPGLSRSSGAITIPVGRPASGGPATALAGIFDLASLDQRPVPRLQARPAYPLSLRRAGVGGDVVVEFVVDADGNVRDAFAIRSSHREFEIEAINAVLKWKFRPGKKGGVAVATRMRVPIPFTLATD